MKRSLIFLLSLLLFVGCSKDDVAKSPDENIEKNRRIEHYANWVDNIVLRQMVDNLDYLFQASAHRDSLLSGGDTEVVIKRQFSNPNLRPPQFNEDGEICQWYYVGENIITHNGISIDKDGAEWTVHSYAQRFWYAPSQPEQVDCQWTVSRNDGVYTLSGGMIHNGLWEEFFTQTEITNLQFTTSRVAVRMFPYGEGVKHTRCYSFDGDVDITKVINNGNTPNPNIKITLNALNGYNSKPYNRRGDPVFLPNSVYFTSGAISASVYDDQEPLHFAVDFSKSEISDLEL